MGIEIYLPKSMSVITKGKDIVEVDGDTIGECLACLISMLPGLEMELFYAGAGDSLATEGKLWSKVEIKVNGDNVKTDVMARKVKPGDNINVGINTH